MYSHARSQHADLTFDEVVLATRHTRGVRRRGGGHGRVSGGFKPSDLCAPANQRQVGPRPDTLGHPKRQLEVTDRHLYRRASRLLNARETNRTHLWLWCTTHRPNGKTLGSYVLSGYW